MWKLIKTTWYQIGIKIFGNFFEKLHYIKMVRKRQQNFQRAMEHRMLKQGLKVFDIDGKKVVARNFENAKRKANKTK